VFFQVLPNFCKQSVSLFGQAVLDTAESKGGRNDEHTIYVETPSPTELKNHNLPLVGFSHNPLNRLEMLQSNNHCYNLQLTRNESYPKT